MEQKKKHNRNIYIVLAVVLCLAGVFFVKDAVRAVEEMAYPRTYGGRQRTLQKDIYAA